MPLIYPPSTGVTIDVSDPADLQTAVDDANAGDKLVVAEGDGTDDGTTLDIDKSLYIKGAGSGRTKIPRVRYTDHIDWPWLEGVTVERTTTADGNGYYGITNHGGGALNGYYFSDIEITGHGLVVGMFLSYSWANGVGVLRNIECHNMEARGLWIYANGLRSWGLNVYNLYRTTNDVTFDVDAVNFGGYQHHSHFWFHDLVEADSLSVSSSGKANPSGPLGTQSTPHLDGFQTYRQFLTGGASWISDRCVFEDGVIDLPEARQPFIFQSNGADDEIVIDPTIRRVLMRGADGQLVNLSGVEGATIEDNTFWIPEDSATTFRAVYFSTTHGDNDRAVVSNNTAYVADGQTVIDGTAPGDITASGNTEIDGSPGDLYLWETPLQPDPPDFSVANWLRTSVDPGDRQDFSLATLMDELADACKTVDGLNRTFGWPTESVEPPAAVVGWPTLVTYSQTYTAGRIDEGEDQYDVPVFVVHGRGGTSRTRRDTIARWLDRDIRRAINSRTYTGDPLVWVVTSETDVVEIANKEYLATLFEVRVET